MAADYPSLSKSEPLVPVFACTPLVSTRAAVLIGAVAAALAFSVTAGAMGAFGPARPDSPPAQVVAGAAGPTPGLPAPPPAESADAAVEAETTPCAEQTWPYIDGACLKDGGGPETRAVRVLPVDAAAQSQIHTATNPTSAPVSAAPPPAERKAAAGANNDDAKAAPTARAKKPRKTAKREHRHHRDTPRSAYASRYERGDRHERRYRYERDDYEPRYGNYGPQWGFD